MSNTLVPDYLNIDFNTIKTRITEQLEATTTFSDMNYEGANITILIELLAYISELTTYYTNQLARNTYLDTANLYENVHRLASLIGYYPYGYQASRGTVTVTINSLTVDIGDYIKAESWVELTSSEQTDAGDEIVFATTKDTFATVTTMPFSFDVEVTQGKVRTYTYYGRDLIDNRINLPYIKLAYDDDIDDDIPVIEVTVAGTPWTRISDFYDDISGLLDEDNVYMFNYDKYGHYTIDFLTIRNVPTTDQEIIVKVLETLGSDGNVGAATLTNTNEDLLINITKSGVAIAEEAYTVTNSGATIGGTLPETTSEIKTNARGFFHAQYRNVTKVDYINYLQARTDVSKAAVWGEQEITPEGYFPDYNKVYISLAPNDDDWGSTTVNGVNVILDSSDVIFIPTNYSLTYMTNIAEYLEPRKMLCAYEEFVLPDLVYFKLNAGLILKRTYRYDTVLVDVKRKLEYYFSSVNREFGETIEFTDIEDFIMDTSIADDTDTFPQTKGLYKFIIRNIDVFDKITSTWIEPFDYRASLYPQYAVDLSSNWDENVLRNITLGFAQFPKLAINSCNFTQET